MGTRYVCAWVVLATVTVGCSDWTPIRSAHDVEGQRVKIESTGKDVVIEEVVTCDPAGFVIARELDDCNDPALTFDTRKSKVLVRDKDSKSSIDLVVAGVLAAIFVPAAIVGSAILTAR